MYVQLWDADLLTSNDAIGMAELPLARWLKQAYMRRVLAGTTAQTKGPVYWSAKFDWEGPKEARPKLASNDKKGFGGLSEIATSIIEQQPLLDEEDPELEAAKFWMYACMHACDLCILKPACGRPRLHPRWRRGVARALARVATCTCACAAKPARACLFAHPSLLGVHV